MYKFASNQHPHWQYFYIRNLTFLVNSTLFLLPYLDQLNEHTLFILSFEVTTGLFRWLRPKDIFKDGFVLFQDINPDDIKQGCLGNWYFLSALSALAEFPEYIKRIFVNEEVNESGLYLVNFTLGGSNYKVAVDDHFPYYPKKGMSEINNPLTIIYQLQS